MKKFLIAGSSLAAVAAVGSAGAVDVTLGGSIDMGVDFGLGKANGNLQMGSAFNEVSLSINAAHTTDGGLAFGGGFTMGTSDELKFAPYDTNGTAAGGKMLVKATVTGQTNIENQLWAVSGGGAIDSGNVVSVKINSAWRGLDGTQTLHQVPLSSFTSSNICKVAGRGDATTDHYFGFTNLDTPVSTSSGTDDMFNTLEEVDDGYLPAGRLWHRYSSSNYGDLTMTKGTGVSREKASSAYGNNRKFTVDFQTAKTGKGVAPAPEITMATVYIGPFMEVMMASSETKMVVGAACVTGVSSSDTSFFLDNKSKVMTVSDASIYIEGGFGRLTLQSGDYAGGVGAIAGAGDQADIDADGLVLVAQGLGLMGANPYIAMDFGAGDALSDLEVITGGTMDLGGVSMGFDMVLGNGSDLLSVTAWDLGMAYNMGDMSLAAAMDSSSDWGMTASMAVAGFGVNATFGSSSAGDHEKSGITYSVSASTSLNGFGLSIGFDEDLEPSIGVDYDLGGLTLYAGYDADDEGGSIGATLSF